jgi:hypothetical protein
VREAGLNVICKLVAYGQFNRQIVEVVSQSKPSVEDFRTKFFDLELIIVLTNSFCHKDWRTREAAVNTIGKFVEYG